MRKVHTGEILFEPNDTNVRFFVVLYLRTAGEFTGEMTVFSGQRSLVRGRMTESGELIELEGAALRPLVARDAQLSEIREKPYIRVYIRRSATSDSALTNPLSLKCNAESRSP